MDLRRGIPAAIVAAALLATIVAPASAHHGARPAAELGVARVFAPEQGSEEPKPSDLSAARYRWRIPRARTDRPDLVEGPLIHVVYVTTTDHPSPPLDRRGILEDSVRSIDAWTHRQAGMRWRLDTFRFDTPKRPRPVRAVDVTFVPSGRPGVEMDTLEEVRRLLAQHGLDRSGKRYLVYVASDAGNVCGEGEYPLGPEPEHTGNYSAVYLFSAKGCGTSDFAPNRRSPSWVEAVAAQELIHNDGTVPLAAPHACHVVSLGHVCTPGLVLTDLDPEREDVMFPFASGPLRKKVLDRGRDDYFRHPFPYRDLADSPYLRGSGG